jgi:PAS domain-containing protein
MKASAVLKYPIITTHCYSTNSGRYLPARIRGFVHFPFLSSRGAGQNPLRQNIHRGKCVKCVGRYLDRQYNYSSEGGQPDWLSGPLEDEGKGGNSVDGRERKVLEAVQGHFGQELLANMIEFFPYPIQVFDRDGTAVLINRAALEMIGIRSIEDSSKMYTGGRKKFSGASNT